MENFSQLVEMLSYLVAIIGGVAGGTIYLVQVRRKSIEQLRVNLARQWTNEGDILENEEIFITLILKLQDGDLYGSLTTSSYRRDLEAHVDVGWGTARPHVSELTGRSIGPVGVAKLRLTGNRNRLDWKLVGTKRHDRLPKKTQLWPLNTLVVE